MYYKYEMHCHDSNGSKCAINTPEEMVAAYKKVGYSGMVITNHFLRGNTAVNRDLPWEDKMKAYYDSYLRAKAVAGDNFHVFFGLEHNYGNGKEVLTYGIDLDFLLNNPEIHMLSLREYADLVHKAGGFLAQAHPFRKAGFINPDVMPQPECLDAVEGYNYCNTKEENKEAMDYAKNHNLYTTSGGDVHETTESGLGFAGMAFDKEIKTPKELVDALNNHEGKMIINGKIVE